MGNWKEGPPRTPQHLEDLDRAIMLLGSMAKGDNLKLSKREELEEAARVPAHRLPKDEDQAQTWKRSLKQWRKELVG